MGTVKKLTKIGNSYGVILPQEVLRIVGIDPKKGCHISIEKERVTIEPAQKTKSLDDNVAESMIRFMKRYRSDLQKLSST